MGQTRLKRGLNQNRVSLLGKATAHERPIGWLMIHQLLPAGTQLTAGQQPNSSQTEAKQQIDSKNVATDSGSMADQCPLTNVSKPSPQRS